jgi:hypothetical protein
MKDLDPAFRGSGQKEYPFQDDRISFISFHHYIMTIFLAFCHLHAGQISNLSPIYWLVIFGKDVRYHTIQEN